MNVAPEGATECGGMLGAQVQGPFYLQPPGVLRLFILKAC